MAMIHDLIPWRDRDEDGNIRTLSRLQRDIDSIFDDFFRSGGIASAPARFPDKGAVLAPKLDVAETDKGYHLSVELPGVSEKDVDVSLHEGVLTIRGEKKAEEKKEGKNWHRVERTYGSFQRSVSLPKEIDEDAVSASFKHGVLSIDVPKSEKKKNNSKKIEVKAS